MRNLSNEELEQVYGGTSNNSNCPDMGNNGFGNGGDDPAPGNSGTNGSPNADQKLADVVR